MTKLRNTTLILIGIFVFFVSPSAFAQGSADTDGAVSKEHFGQRIQEIYNQLHLTDDQKKQLEANKQEHRARMEAAWQEMKTKKQAIKDELMKAQLDMPKINELHGQIKALMSRMEDDKLNSILAVRHILTTEQFTKFDDLLHKHRQSLDK